MLFAEATQVIQVEWQGLAAAGATVAGAIVAAAKLLANQMAAMHADNRADAKEARDENRALSQSILTQQGQTIGVLVGMQAEIHAVLHGQRNGEGGSKQHKPL